MWAVKKKQWVLSLISFSIIAVVILSTLFGYNMYLQWKNDILSISYRDSIFRITAEIFRGEIEVSGLMTVFGDTASPQKGPYMEGRIRNNSGKTVTSMMLEISIQRPDGVVLYRDWFFPLGGDELFSSPFFSTAQREEEALKAGEIITFRYPLRNCPQEAIRALSRKKDFARKTGAGEIILEVSVSGMKVS